MTEIEVGKTYREEVLKGRFKYFSLNHKDTNKLLTIEVRFCCYCLF